VDWYVALTKALHEVRARLPEAELSRVAGIRPNRLKKIRAGSYQAYIEEGKVIARCVHEVAPALALDLIQASVPPELYSVAPLQTQPAPLAREVVDAARSAGKVSERFLEATEDGRLDNEELDELEAAYADLAEQAAEGIAAVDRIRQKQSKRGCP